MRRISGLDALIGRFRERWETDPRYRAAMSGVIGLVVVVSMCACMAGVSVFANNALAGGGFTSGTGGQQTGGGVVQAAPSFPTPTEPAWQVPATPVWSPVPNSQTPVPPTPTIPAPPTATPSSSGLSGIGEPNPWTFCSGGNKCDKVIVTGPPNLKGIFVSISYPATAQPITGYVNTDGSGMGTFKFTGSFIPSGSGTALIQLVYGVANPLTGSFTWNCVN